MDKEFAAAALEAVLEKSKEENWDLEAAAKLCREIEEICPPFGCHVALTGGCLYKDGRRKDVDILFYKIRQTPEINKDGLFAALESLGVAIGKTFGWVTKAKYQGHHVDLFFPEQPGELPATNKEGVPYNGQRAPQVMPLSTTVSNPPAVTTKIKRGHVLPAPISIGGLIRITTQTGTCDAVWDASDGRLIDIEHADGRQFKICPVCDEQLFYDLANDAMAHPGHGGPINQLLQTMQQNCDVCAKTFISRSDYPHGKTCPACAGLIDKAINHAYGAKATKAYADVLKSGLIDMTVNYCRACHIGQTTIPGGLCEACIDAGLMYQTSVDGYTSKSAVIDDLITTTNKIIECPMCGAGNQQEHSVCSECYEPIP